MRTIKIILIYIALCGLVCGASFADHKSGEVIVTLKQGVKIEDVAQKHGCAPLKRILGTNTYLVQVAKGYEASLVANLNRDPDVLSAERNAIIIVPEVDQKSMAFVDQKSMAFVDQKSMAFVDGQSPPDYFGQPAVYQINLNQAHAVSKGRGVVAVIDTGVDYSHPALAGRVRLGYDFVDNDYDPNDPLGGIASGHGTHVSGIISLVAPGAIILAIRVISPDGTGDIFSLAAAIRHAADSGANAINLSLGIDVSSQVLDSAIEYAIQKGSLVLASAGNNNSPVPQYPAAYQDVVAVTAVDSNDIKAYFANYGRYVDLTAPGVSIYSAYPGGRYAYWSGTSFAVPFASGLAALVLGVVPNATAETLRKALENGAVNIDGLNPDYRNRLGKGRINCLASVTNN